MIKYLLAAGADVNAHIPQTVGDTPLGAIACSCSFVVAKILTDAGADPTIPGWMQLTALDRAKDRNRDEGDRVYALLLDVAKRKFQYVGK